MRRLLWGLAPALLLTAAPAAPQTWSQSVLNANPATTPGPTDMWALVQGGVMKRVAGNLLLYGPNNLSDLGNIETALGNLGLGPAFTPTFSSLHLTSMSGVGFRCVHADASGAMGTTNADCNTGGGGGGGSPIAWPAPGSLVISNGGNNPPGIAPVPNDLLAATPAGAWAPLATAGSRVLCTDPTGVPSLCAPGAVQAILGYQTGNQAINLTGDASGTGTTTIPVTVNQVHGVAYPATNAVNVVPVITSTNLVTYKTGTALAALPGFGTMLTQNANNVAVTGGSITGLTPAVNPGDVPNKAYVDAAVTGSLSHPAVAATTAAVLPNSPVAAGTGVGKTLTSGTNTALVVDGYTVPLNARVGVTQQAAAADNGIYVQTTLGTGSVKWVLTRATDFDQAVAGEVALGAYFNTLNGTANAGKQFGLGSPTPATIVVDTTALTFNQLTSGSVSADGTTILNTGGVFSVIPSGALDVLGSTRGSILERGASGWATIAPGTSGFAWISNGAGADPSWQAIPAASSGMTAGYLGIAANASSFNNSIGYSNTASANKIGQLNSSGLWDTSMLPQATAGAFGAVKCGSGTTCTAGVISATAGGDTGTVGVAAAGATLASATVFTTQQVYVSSGANCTTPTTTQCIGNAAVKPDPALMVAFNHMIVCDEDPVNAVLLYPANAAHTINNMAAGVGIPIGANQCAYVVAKSATALRTVP